MLNKLFFVSCINTEYKDFKELQSKYNLSVGELENALSVFQNETGEVYNPESKELQNFLNKRYKKVTDNIISKRKDYDLFHRIWEQNNNLTFNDDDNYDAKYEQLKRVFGEENVTLYTNEEGKYTISIAEPLIFDKEMRDILSNASRNEEGKLLAPNGKISNLTEMQYAQVRTKAFKEWFGDWENDKENSSKVLDENSEPLVVYHESTNKFNIFDLSKKRYNVHKKPAIWTSPIDREGDGYGEYRYPLFLNIRNLGETKYKKSDTFPQMRERENFLMEKSEYDGIKILTFDKFGEETQYAAYNPNQVKSATSNIGEFNKENNNIYQRQSYYIPIEERVDQEFGIDLDKELSHSIYDLHKLPLFKNAALLAKQLGIKFQYKPLDDTTYGEYFNGIASIGIKQSSAEFIPTLYHELLHSVTSHILHANKDNLTEKQNKAVEIINKVFEYVKNDTNSKWYGLKNIDEFVAELSNNDFREYLKSVKIDKKTLWDKILDFFRAIFIEGFDNNALEISDKTIEYIISSQISYPKRTINSINNYSLSHNEKEEIQNYLKNLFKSNSKLAKNGKLEKYKTSTGRILNISFNPKENETIENIKTGDGFQLDAEYDSYGNILEKRHKREIQSNSIIQQTSQLSTEDKEMIEQELGTIQQMQSVEKENEEKSKQDNSVTEQARKELIESNEKLAKSTLLSAREKSFLANNIMSQVSIHISMLQNNPEANQQMFDDEFEDKDFTSMSRLEIIKTVGIDRLLNFIKEYLFNSENRDMSMLPRAIRKKYKEAYDNWVSLIEIGYPKLIATEGVSLTMQLPEGVTQEGIEEAFREQIEQGESEEKSKEYWQVGIRNISAKASLSQDIRRMLEKLYVTDKAGNYIKDEFGFGLDTFVDSSVAVNSILDWCKECTTMEEMIKVLKNKIDDNTWIPVVLEQIKKEPLKSQFYQNFRKDFTRYSIITVQYENGKRIYINKIINTNGVTDSILDEITSSYALGEMQEIITTVDTLTGKGRVNKANIESLQTRLSNVYNNIKNAKSSGKVTYKEAIENSSSELASILKELGIRIDTSTVAKTLSTDKNLNTYNIENTTFGEVNRQLKWMFKTLIKNSERQDYNPMDSTDRNNSVYSNYKNIIKHFEENIQQSIESSVYQDGKMYYSFVTPSYVGKLMRNLKNSLNEMNKFKEFMQNEYGQYRWFKDGDTWLNTWLQKLNSSDVARNTLEHKVQLTFEGTGYKELSPLAYTTSLIQEYFYNGTNSNLAWYHVPILSNKPSSEFIKFEAYNGADFKDRILEGLTMTFNQELLRIRTVLDRMSNSNIEQIKNFDVKRKDLKDKYDIIKIKFKSGTLTFEDLLDKNGKFILKKSGASFKFLDIFNGAFEKKTSFGQQILDRINGKSTNEDSFSAVLKDALIKAMDIEVKKELEEFDKMGLFEFTTRKDFKTNQELIESKHLFNLHSSFENIYQRKFGKSIPKKTVDKNTGKKVSTISKEEIQEVQKEMTYEMYRNMEKYIWNSHLATINIVQLTATDLAYYKNVEDFQKRYAQVHSPGLRLNIEAEVLEGSKYHINDKYSADGKFRTMYIADEISPSEIIENVKAIFDRKIKSLSTAQKPAMEAIRDKIINAFKTEVNVTDAQAYNSLTSMRKKLGMQGKWSEDLEKAYERVKEGNFNINDLNILMQPLKPFVYSQITKNSGSDIMKNLKVGVQYKNSEYLLFIAEALTRSDDSRPNKLKAIADFMEETAFDTDGSYNGKGIDTIQFQSAVKVGEMGVIDITKAKTYDEVKKILKANTYLSEVIDSKNSLDNYNANYIHTYNAEDFAVQQEVPAHMQDHQQQWGSQMRALAISDIIESDIYNVNGKSITGKELKDRYQELLANNIQKSFDELTRELNLNGTKLEKNKALERVLRDAILNDVKYGSDLLKACTLNNEGEFNIPLLDPIQSNRVQQLLNSIIKNRIYKQKIAGGPVVQVSSFGMSSKVNIVFKDKNIMSLEDYKKTNPEATDGDYKKYLEDSKASIDYYECYITCPDSKLEKDLTRIDKNGNEYLLSPEEALVKGIITEDVLKGIAYRIPTENKYSMMPIKIKGFLPRAAGEAIILPEEITLITGSDFDIDKMYTMFKSITNRGFYKFNSYLQNKRAEWRKQGLNLKERRKKEDELNIIFDEIRAGRDKDTYEMQVFDELEEGYKVKGWRTSNREGSREGNNNEVFDLTWSVLTSEHTSDKIFDYGSFDEQKKSARIIQVLENSDTKYSYEELSKLDIDELDELIESSSNRNILHPTSQIYFHKQNMTAGKLIGIFANHNVSHALLDSLDITLNLHSKNSFSFDGYTLMNGSNNTLDAIKRKDGGYISKTIAGFVAASVDAVKDPVLNFMNLNTATASTAMFLARMGFDSDSIGLFLTQPIIKSVVDEYFKINSEGFTTIDSVINDTLNKMNISKNTIKRYRKSLKNTNFDKNELASGVSNKSTNTDFQIRSLLLFQRLYGMASKLNDLTFITKFNSVNNAVGPTIGDTLEKELRLNKFLQYIKEAENPLFKSADIEKVLNIPIINKFYESNMKLSKSIFKDNFIQYNDRFTTALNKLMINTKGNIDADIINRFANEFILFSMTSGDSPIINGSFENRESYIKNFPEYFKKKTENIKGNAFVDMIKLNQSTNKFPAKSLSMDSVGQSLDLQQAVKDGWEELIKNPETKDLAIHLFKYNIYRSGLSFSPKTFLHQASNEVKNNVDNYIDFLREVNDLGDIGYREFINQFKRNHSDSFKLVTRFIPNKSINIEKEEELLTFTISEGSNIDDIVVNECIDFYNYTSHIVYENELYEYYVSSRKRDVTYKKVTTLGNKNNALEYNANETTPKSIFKSTIDNTLDENGKGEMKDPTIASSKQDSEQSSNYIDYGDYIDNNTALQDAMIKVFTDEELGYIGDSESASALEKVINKHLQDKNLEAKYRKIFEQTKEDLNLC